MSLLSLTFYVTANDAPGVQSLLDRNNPRQSLLRARPQAGTLPQNSTTSVISGAIDLIYPLRDVPDRGERVDVRHRTEHLRT